jgi:hypothetical protein
MTLYDRYTNGQTEQVYQDIYALGQDAFLPDKFPGIEKVLTETFQRPLVKPLPDTEKLLVRLENAIRPFGFMPLSLKMFYRIVGA